MTHSEIEDLKRLLQRMREHDPDFRVFGADWHQYLLGETLSERRVIAFEEQHKVRLPEDYRTFLMEAGDGMLGPVPKHSMKRRGAGPGYGLSTLEEAAKLSDLSQPFPWNPSSQPMTEEEHGALIDEDKWPAVPGALTIGFGGCSYYYHLIVNGPYGGTMWESCETDYFPMGATFDDWYKKWISGLMNHVLPRLAEDKKAEEVTVGMSRERVIGICGGEWEIKSGYRNNILLVFQHLSTDFELSTEGLVKSIHRRGLSV